MKILIAAGGTGGHIWPALSFNQWIVRNRGHVESLFLSGSRDMERELYRHAGVAPVVLPVEGSPLSGPLRTRVSRTVGLARSIAEVGRVVREFSPHICLLFGGYVSVPAMVVSKMKGVPILLHEPNAKAGRVTCIAAKARIPVCTGWEVCEPLPSGGFTPVGVPIRNLRRLPPEDAWKLLGYDLDLPPSPRVLVLGGSLGSDPMTFLFSKVSAERLFCSINFLVVGSSERAVRASGNLWLLPREWEIDLLYSIADGVVSRAGASTLAELVAFGLPSVIIPWRGAADDHQEHNARVFSEKGFGSIWEIDNGILENLAFMIDYELKRARLGQAFQSPGMGTGETCEKIWELLQQIAEGRGRN